MDKLEQMKQAARVFGAIGGAKTSKKYGKDHYRRIALLAVDKRKENRKKAMESGA